MKKIVILMLALFSGIIYAQEITFGAKAGVNLATVTGDTEDEEGIKKGVEPIIGFNVGGFVNYRINQKIAVQPELYVSYQGAKAEVTEYMGQPLDASKKINLPYLMLPVLVQYYPIEKLRVELGPQIGYNFTEAIDFKGTVNINGNVISLEEKMKDIAKFDISLNIGVGYALTDRINVFARFNKGLNSINTKNKGVFGWKIYNQVTMLGLEYEF